MTLLQLSPLEKIVLCPASVSHLRSNKHLRPFIGRRITQHSWRICLNILGKGMQILFVHKLVHMSRGTCRNIFEEGTFIDHSLCTMHALYGECLNFEFLLWQWGEG